MKDADEMNEWPIIQSKRSHAREVQFTDKQAMIHLADDRILGVPLSWFPPILHATNQQRQKYISYGDTVYWHDVDDGIDLTAMLTGLYIVPVNQRNTRSKPHIPTTWLYLDGGSDRVPFVHDTRNIPKSLRWTDNNIIFELDDGRILCLPPHFSRKLTQASDSQRQNYHVTGLSVCWEQLDVSIDLIAMLTGFYDQDSLLPEEVIETTSTAPT